MYIILYIAKTLQATLGVFWGKDLSFMSGMMLIICGHPDVHVLSEQDGIWHVWHGGRYFCNLKAAQTRTTQPHSAGKQF